MPAAIFEAVLGNVAVAAGVAVLAALAARRLNRPAVAHALWLLVLVKLVTPPLFVVPLRWLPAREAAPAPSFTLPVVPSALPPAAVAPRPVPVTAAVVPVGMPRMAIPEPPAAAPRPAGLWVPAWESVVLTLWAAGGVVYAAVVFRRVRRFGKLLAFGAKPPADFAAEVERVAAAVGVAPPRVRVLPGGIAPLVWAVGRPTLYFPAGLLARLSPDQRAALVAHELAHLRRWDHVVRVLEFVAVAVYWWCPLAWVARRELRRLEEEACDAEVGTVAPGSGFAYASAIVETIDYVAGVAPTPALASGIGDAASLRRRLVLILDGQPAGRTDRRTRLALLLAGVAVLGVGPRLDRLDAAAKAAAPQRPASSQPARLSSNSGVEPPEYTPFQPTPRTVLPADGTTVQAAAMSPDGSRLALASGPAVRVWHVASRQVIAELVGHADAVKAVAFSPDGTRIATGSNDATAAVWDAATGAKLHALTGHDRWVLAVAFSPDGKLLATGSYDRSVRLWDAETGTLRAAWTGHAAGVTAVAFSPDGKLLATGGADHAVLVWQLADGVVHPLRKHAAAVRVLAFSPDGTTLASGAEDHTVRLWHAADGRELAATTLPDFVTALGFAPDGHALFAGILGGHLFHLHPPSGRVRSSIGVEPGRDAATPAHAAAVAGVFVHPSGMALVSVARDRTVLAWPAARTDTPDRSFRGPSRTTAVAVSPDGRVVATGGQDGVIRLWDAETAAEIGTLSGHPGGVTNLVFAPDGRLASTGADERVRVWDTATRQPTRTLVLPSADLCVAVSADGTLAVGGRKISGVTLLDTSTGKVRRVGEWTGVVAAVAFGPGGRLATGYGDGMVRLWDSTDGAELARGFAGTGSADGLAFDPDGSTLAVVLNRADESPRHEVVFLAAKSVAVRDDLRPLPHPGPVAAAAFRPDGTVVTAGHDGNLRVWDVTACRVVRTVRGHADPVRGLAVAADGRSVFSAGDRAAKQWPMPK